jgi:hypothetical protein
MMIEIPEVGTFFMVKNKEEHDAAE